MKHNKLFSKIALGIACTLGLGAAIGAGTGLFDQKDVEIKEADAAVETIYTHTFASGDFRTDRWWGVDSDVFWGDALDSTETDGGTFTASEYLRRFVYENSSGQEIDNIYIPVHFTGDVTVKLVDDATSTSIATQYYHSGDNAISFTDLNTTAKKLAANVNRTSGSANSTARVLYGETVVISRTSSVTVTLDANGGTGGPSSVTCVAGEAMPSIAGNLPTRTGYTFNGYFTATSGGTKYYNANGTSAATYPGDSVTKLYAQWTANSYTVNYNGNKPSSASSNVTNVPSSNNCTYDQNFNLGSAPSLTGWTFGGWYKESGCTNKVGNAGASVKNVATSGTITLYAKWTANTYTVRYNANKPSNATGTVTNLPANATWTYDSNATLGSAPSLTGWTFGGWYKDAACTDKAGNASQQLTKPNYRSTSGTYDLYAKWTANTYTVRYNANKPDGAPSSYPVEGVPANDVWTYDQNATLGSAPTLTGYVFDGWYKEAACTNKVGDANQQLTKPNLTATNNATVDLYAKWRFNEAIQTVVDKINNTKVVDYEDLTDAINDADSAYNALDSELKAVVDSEGYTHILDNAKAADVVGQMIEDLGPSEDTEEWRDAVEEARAAYNALEDKSFIPSDTILKILVDDEAAISVMDLINAIGDVTYTVSSKALIDTANTAYSSLTNDQKALVVNYDVLVQANTDYDNVDTSVNKINAIQYDGNLDLVYSPANKDLIDDARDYYDALSEYQKSIHPQDTLKELVDAEAAYNSMDKIHDIGSAGHTEQYKEEVKVARDTYDALTEDQKDIVNPDMLKALMDNEAALDFLEKLYDADNSTNPTEYQDKVHIARDTYDALTNDQKALIDVVDVKALLDREENNEVAQKIEAIVDTPFVEYSPENKALIDEARDAYEALTDDQKEVFPNDILQILIGDEKAYESMDKIKHIGEITNTDECRNKIQDARNYYNSLTDNQKPLVDPAILKLLTDDEAAMKVIVEVNSIKDETIVEYTPENKVLIDTARKDYESLSADQKALVPESVLKTLVDDEKAYESMDIINDIGEVIYDYESKDRIDEARQVYESLTSEQKALVDPDLVKLLTTSEETFDKKQTIGNVIVIVFLILSCLLLVAGCFVLYLLFKKKKDDDDKDNKGVKVASFSLPVILAAATSTSHYLDAPFIALYVIAGLTILVWLVNLVVWLNKKYHFINKCLEKLGVVKPNKTTKPLNDEEEEVIIVTDKAGNRFQIRFIKSFTAKLIQSSDETKAYYTELKNEVLSYKKTNSRVSWHFDSINAGRTYVIKFGMRGKTLCVYYPLNADDYADSKYKVEKAEAKKYADVPCLYRINNGRRVTYAKELIAVVASKLGLEKGEVPSVNYYLPYEPREPLLARGLIKELKVALDEPKKEEVIVSNDEEEVIRVVENGVAFDIRFNRSYTAKLIQASDEAKSYYQELKNYVLGYKGVSNRVSWNYESFNYGHEQLIKFGVKGKTLCLYYHLDSKKYQGSKYLVEEVSSKKYEGVPCLYRIKNPRRCNYAKELIDEVMKVYNVINGKEVNEKYDLPYEPREPLLVRGLIKEIKTKAKVEVKALDHAVSVSEADEKMSDEVAASKIIIDSKSKKHNGKKAIINIDIIGEKYNDGDEVTLESLVEKKLVPSNTGYVKVLARGLLNKKLTVDLQEYSIQAVKMILLEGGTVKKAK